MLISTWCRECVQRPCCTASVAALARVRAPDIAGVREADKVPLIPQARRVRGLPAVLLGAGLRGGVCCCEGPGAAPCNPMPRLHAHWGRCHGWVGLANVVEAGAGRMDTHDTLSQARGPGGCQLSLWKLAKFSPARDVLPHTFCQSCSPSGAAPALLIWLSRRASHHDLDM